MRVAAAASAREEKPLPILAVLADPILPVVAILVLGFFLGRTGKVSQDDARSINKLALVVLLPCLLFGLLSEAPVEEFRLTALAWYAASEAILFALGFLLAWRLLKRERREAVLLAFAAIFSNTVLFVLPISLLLYGPQGVLAITTVVTLDSVVPFGAAIIAMEILTSGKVSLGATLMRIARTPLIIAMAGGLAVAISGLTLPEPVTTFLHFNGAAAGPVALFALGVVLSRTRFTADPAVAIFTVVKLVLFPALVWAGLHVVIEPGPQFDLFVLAAAGPSGAMAFSLALFYSVRTDTIAQLITITSALSVLSLALLAP